MKLFNEVLVGILEREGIHVSLSDLATIATEAVDSECCRALEKIKKILVDNNLSDSERIGEISYVMERLGNAS